jgi:glycosyltransferase involved in cell wall biosynthesis
MKRHAEAALITTIIPTYRRPEMLRRAIRSVLNQTFPHFQLCIYDNASGDDTTEVVAEFTKKDLRVKYFCHPHNIGAIPNYNHGLREVRTPLFSLLADDDILLPDFYKITLAGFDKYPQAMFSAGATLVMNEKGEEVLCPMSWWPREGYFAPPEGLLTMIGKKKSNHIFWTGILFRSELRQQIGLLDEELHFADHDFQLRISARFPFVISKKPCAIFLRHPAQSISKVDISWFWPAWLATIKKIREDEQIPLVMREQVGKSLLDQLARYLFSPTFLMRKDYAQSLRAADILKNELDAKLRGELLHFLTKLCERYSPLYNVLYNFRESFIKIRSNRYKAKYHGLILRALNRCAK